MNCVEPGFAQPRPRKDAVVFPGAIQNDTQDRALPPSRNLRLQRLREVGLGELTPEERARIRTVGSKPRIGVHRELPDDSLATGTWSTLADGRRIWRLSVRSSAAAGLRVEFFDFSVGTGQVWIHSGDLVDGPYTGEGPYGNGEFWSAILESESAIIEYAAPAGSRTDTTPPFRVRRVAHHESLIGQGGDNAAGCTLDVNCFPAWQDTKKSVAHIVFEETNGDQTGTFLCSATLVSTRDNSFKPYLLTAGHCIHSEAAARSLQTYWSYESTGCNQGPPANKGTVKSANGGHLLAFEPISRGDFSLVLLPDVPSGVVFAGWDPQPLAEGTPVVGIHHPRGSYKRISFGTAFPAEDVAVNESPSLNTAPGELFTAIEFTNGVVQPGSSGSAIFTGPGVVAGIASYGAALPEALLCSASSTAAGYSRFSNTYPNINAYLEDLPFSQVSPSASALTFTGLNRAFTGGVSQTFTLTTQSVAPVNYKLRSDVDWITISPDRGTVSASTPARITVSVDPRYFMATSSYTTPITVLSGAAPPVFVNVRVDMKIDTSTVTVSAIPNPVSQNGTTWSLRLHLAESNGSPTRVTGLRIDGADYSEQIAAWFGSNRIAALGALDANINTSGLVTPVDKFFEFFGRDEGSGQTWYRTLTVTFK